MVAENHLKSYGITTDTAASGEEAIRKVEKQSYDMVFMDHMMPGMSGIEAAIEIRSIGSTVPLIALTANVMAEAAEQFLKAGMDDYLSKPIIVRELTKILRKYIPPEKILP
jgi:CheY-like chemotaxis protein